MKYFGSSGLNLTKSVGLSSLTSVLGVVNNVLLLNTFNSGEYASWLAISAIVNLIAYSDLGDVIVYRGKVLTGNIFEKNEIITNVLVKSIFFGALTMPVLMSMSGNWRGLFILVTLRIFLNIVDIYLLEISIKKDKAYIFYMPNLFVALVTLIACLYIYFLNIITSFWLFLYMFFGFQIFMRVVMLYPLSDIHYKFQLSKNLLLKVSNIRSLIIRLSIPLTGAIAFYLINNLIVSQKDDWSFVVKIYLLIAGFINIFGIVSYDGLGKVSRYMPIYGAIVASMTSVFGFVCLMYFEIFSLGLPDLLLSELGFIAYTYINLRLWQSHAKQSIDQ